MAVGARGTVAFSNDGLNWSRLGLTTLSLYDIAYGNGMYVVVGDSGCVFTTPDLRGGMSWKICLLDSAANQTIPMAMVS